MVWPTLGSRTAKEQNRTGTVWADARDGDFGGRVWGGCKCPARVTHKRRYAFISIRYLPMASASQPPSNRATVSDHNIDTVTSEILFVTALEIRLVVELEGYGRPTCSKQPRRVGRRTYVRSTSSTVDEFR